MSLHAQFHARFLRSLNLEHHVDPVTLTAIGVGLSGLAGAGSLANSLFNAPKAPSMPAPTPPASTPTGTPTTNAGTGGPSFLAAAAAPPGAGGTANKTLLGQ